MIAIVLEKTFWILVAIGMYSAGRVHQRRIDNDYLPIDRRSK